MAWPDETHDQSRGAFFRALGDEFPEIAEVMAESVAAHGEPLSYLILGDLARYMEDRYGSPEGRLAFEGRFREIFVFIGRAFERAPEDLADLIALGLVENMPYPSEPAADLVDLLPTNLADELRKQRG